MNNYFFLVVLLGIMPVSCSHFDDYRKINQEEEPKLQIVGHKTIDCKIANWYNDYEYTTNFTWDDANLTHEKIANIFEKYDYTSTYFVQTYAFTNQKYVKLYKNIYSRGNEIASHTVHHRFLEGADLNYIEKELVNSSNDIYRIFGYSPVTFAHPGSQYNRAIDMLVDKYYLSSRYSSTINIDDRAYWCFRKIQGMEHLKNWFKRVTKENTKNWIILSGHGVDGEGYEPIKAEFLDELLGYIKTNYSQNIWVTTFANSAMYKFLRENIEIEYGTDFVYFNLNKVNEKIDKYSSAKCVITIIFPDAKNTILLSDGIIQNDLKGEDRIVSLDLRKSRQIFFVR